MMIMRHEDACVLAIQILDLKVAASNPEYTCDSTEKLLHAKGELNNKIASKIVQNTKQPELTMARLAAHGGTHG